MLTNARYVLSAGSDTQVLWGGLLEVVTAMACIGSAVVLFPVIRRHHEAAALGFVTARVLEAALIATGIASMLSEYSFANRTPPASKQRRASSPQRAWSPCTTGRSSSGQESFQALTRSCWAT